MKASDVRAATRALDRRLALCERIEHLENRDNELTIYVNDYETGDELGQLEGFDEVVRAAREAMLRKLHAVRDELDNILIGLGVTDFDEPVTAEDEEDDDEDGDGSVT